MVSQELRLSSFEARFKWLVGAYCLRNDTEPQDSSQTTLLPDGSVFFEIGTDEQFTERAIFGEASFDITPQCRATFGARAADFQIRSASVLLEGMGLASQRPGTVTGPFSVDESKVTTKYELSYRPTEDVMLYARVAQGFRPAAPTIRRSIRDSIRMTAFRRATSRTACGVMSSA